MNVISEKIGTTTETTNEILSSVSINGMSPDELIFKLLAGDQDYDKIMANLKAVAEARKSRK